MTKATFYKELRPSPAIFDYKEGKPIDEEAFKRYNERWDQFIEDKASSKILSKIIPVDMQKLGQWTYCCALGITLQGEFRYNFIYSFTGEISEVPKAMERLERMLSEGEKIDTIEGVVPETDSIYLRKPLTDEELKEVKAWIKGK